MPPTTVADAELDPTHWAVVRHGLRELYIGFWWNFLSCGLVGQIWMVLGHRRLARNGPTAGVRAVARLRVQLVAILVLGGALAVIAARADQPIGIRVAAAVPVLAAAATDQVLWTVLGARLAAWAGSRRLVDEWWRTRQFVVASLALGYAFIGLGGLGATAFVWVGLAALTVGQLRLWFTSWRTYALFRKDLVPPPPGGAGMMAPCRWTLPPVP
jgi:hypothetical protein